MKKSLLPFPVFCLITASAFAQSAAPEPPQRDSREADKAYDRFYQLGPDSKPQDGVPQGKFAAAKVIPSKIFPGTQHTYRVFVPVQYDPAKACAVMIFNDGHAMMGFRPDDFLKVITFVGSFTDIRGGHIYPELVAESPKKPIRLFMQDGRNDNRRPDNLKKDWFYQNLRLKDALEKKGYDLNYTWGIGNHGQKQGGAIFPKMMRWLWRDHPVSPNPTDAVERSFRGPGN